MTDKSKSFDDLLREVFEPSSNTGEDATFADPINEEFDLADAIDIEILMHRNAHFSGSFDVMMEYYQSEGKGILDEVPLTRLEYLQQVEMGSDQDLASYLLSPPETEKVARAREAYLKLREIYEQATDPNSSAKLIADLILSEEEEPEAEITAIVAAGPAIAPYLLQLVNAREFYDPLYPGYGLAPPLAARCLGLLKTPSAIASLFEAISTSDFFGEESIVCALTDIGEPAKAFLLRVLTLRPLTQDNERAARVLTHFATDPEVSHTCLQQLQDPETTKHANLAAYLVLCCEGLTNPEDRKQFQTLTDRTDLQHLGQDIRAISRSWR